MMSKQITDDELRELLYSFDKIDIDLDNMVIEEDIVFSDKHNENMRIYFEKLRAEEKSNRKVIGLKAKYKNYKLIASILIVFFVGTALFNIDTVVAYANKIKEFVINECKEYSLGSVENETFTEKTYTLDDFELHYESDKFKLDDTKILSLYKRYKYVNDNGNYIKITVSDESSNEFIDTENIELIEKEIDGVRYHIAIKEKVVNVYYLKNGLLYNIQSNISEDLLFKEIEKIK